MTLEDLEELRELIGEYGHPDITVEAATELGDYVYQLRDVALSALNLLENLETNDIFLGARKAEVLTRLREELGESK